MNSFTPWVEKYRPNTFNNIVLDPLNKKILKNIIKTEHFPNLLFYGPPGTGKTTSIINLIKSHEEFSSEKNLMIHLNASDERGIDIIRNQINTFVNTKSFFNDGMKFVILDEVDYMTKNAQIALRYLLQDYNPNVRFCLICNYISRIDEALQNEFVRLRFNQLPENEIIKFLNVINEKENLHYSTDTIQLIQKLFNSDIRSMINYMQSNEQLIHSKKIIQVNLWNKLTDSIKNCSLDTNLNFFHEISNEYNIEKRNIVKSYINHIIRTRTYMVTPVFLNFVENIMHIIDINIDYMLPLTILKMKQML
jgi:replication factor C subunit 3/5|tara:strand:- start:3749 stop:4669 length:921 start_codon:yes stop_codon:yes gene_type:complete